MADTVKKEVLLEFLQDLKEISQRIIDNAENATDYNKFEELLQLAQVDEQTIKDIYAGCGFDSWNELFQEKHKSQNWQNTGVACSISKIKGVQSAVDATFKRYISQIP